jgi:hypothetical protein
LAANAVLLGTSDVGMDTLFARQVQFFVRRSPKLLRTPLGAKLSVRQFGRSVRPARIIEVGYSYAWLEFRLAASLI